MQFNNLTVLQKKIWEEEEDLLCECVFNKRVLVFPVKTSVTPQTAEEVCLQTDLSVIKS